MCRWNSALADLRNGIEKDQIRQKLGISKIQWREISMKLNKLQAQSNID
jgi:integrase/recombinase XerD